MSDVKIDIDVLLKEANANYSTKRYRDAARTFEHLITLAIKNNDPEEAIYYGYRATDCWRKAGKEIQRINSFKHLGILALKFSSKLAEDYSNKTKDLREKANVISIAGECAALREKDKSNALFEESIKIYNKLIKSAKDEKTKKSLLEEQLRVVNLMGNENDIKKYSTQIVELYITIADRESKKGDPSSLQEALRDYEDALSICEDIQLKEKISKLKNKIETIREELGNYDPFAT